MDDLIAFLNARLDEDEAAAKQAAGGIHGRRENYKAIVADAADPDNWAIVDLSPLAEDEYLGTHIARHDPARVLREVAAKRAILLPSDDDGDQGEAIA
jgi:hypothetical protein